MCLFSTDPSFETETHTISDADLRSRLRALVASRQNACCPSSVLAERQKATVERAIVTFPHNFTFHTYLHQQRWRPLPLCATSRPSTVASTRSRTWPWPTSGAYADAPDSGKNRKTSRSRHPPLRRPSPAAASTLSCDEPSGSTARLRWLRARLRTTDAHAREFSPTPPSLDASFRR